ncbi:hypothetical protein DFP93_11763 [Aneurinibacillus soli]|uniref:Uncharacterized protein n=1 Tax=Aneurinibacillus soli TaxID=1500254 RepID=A0A0U5AZI6_9BACL|nr:DUF2922 domain-containing protein [Aneurinibacillus soli]PYE59492.1 hypothetical protein DFP93_11763 [Aneurinibacillus soli]BAU29178.1 hypothetical protein CB4_03359 [Aneurinibacillus soli]
MKTLELQFTTAGGGTVTLAVADPIMPINAAAVAAAMDVVISRGIFDTSTGPIVGKKSVRLVDHQVADIALA